MWDALIKKKEREEWKWLKIIKNFYFYMSDYFLVEEKMDEIFKL